MRGFTWPLYSCGLGPLDSGSSSERRRGVGYVARLVDGRRSNEGRDILCPRFVAPRRRYTALNHISGGERK